jgi:DNA-binding CsgD family transcriptional regulator
MVQVVGLAPLVANGIRVRNHGLHAKSAGLGCGAPVQLGQATGHGAHLGDQALVVVIELEAEACRVAPELLTKWFKLSYGEAKLAVEISCGQSPRKAAKTLGLTEDSARVILKRVFTKAGVSRQAELVALVSRLSGLRYEAGLRASERLIRRVRKVSYGAASCG